MARKEFKILVAISDVLFAKKALPLLRKTYTAHVARDIQEFSAKIHKYDFDLIIIDTHFSGLKAEEVYQGINLLHPNSVFVIYTRKDKQALAMRVWKRRAIDYIVYTKEAYTFMEEINKSVRWAIQKREVTHLGKTIESAAKSIQELSRRIEKIF